ncbi:uncharacterized protein L201_003591 [Kwoniella dendrophila CBS 6074]|uniref:Urease accessory protein n=1 Tax=Kwoniella dendrophila CBS 6074 TaxID=1295534 RepID=A0AAX4JVZ2_9TREE
MSTQHGLSTHSTAVTATRPRINKLSAGSGIFELSLPGDSSTNDKKSTYEDISSQSNQNQEKARFTTLSAAYPLKLLTPKPLLSTSSQPSNISLLFTLSYGGGLVSGDVISLKGEIGAGCGLVMLTQGSTKVFKRRKDGSTSTFNQNHAHNQTNINVGNGLEIETIQRLNIKLNSKSFLLLLPDSISPFKNSNYKQIQRFFLPKDKSASILILDWVNSGRGNSEGMSTKFNDINEKQKQEREIWSMNRYQSINEIYLGDKLIMRENMLLDNQNQNQNNGLKKIGSSKIAKNLAPYNVYTTILFVGPKFRLLNDNLKIRNHNTTQYQIKSPDDLIWSFSELDLDLGSGIVRIASKDIEQTRFWLRNLFDSSGFPDLVGEGIWPRCI